MRWVGNAVFGVDSLATYAEFVGNSMKWLFKFVGNLIKAVKKFVGMNILCTFALIITLIAD
jgi:hypothetical protein